MIKQNDKIDKKVDKILVKIINKSLDLGLTYPELSKKAGVSVPTIWSVFNGVRKSRINTIVSILDALDLELVVKEKKK